MTDHPKIRPEEHSIWEKKGTIRIIWIVLIVGCVVAAGLGFYLQSIGKMNYEPHFYGKDGIAGFLGGIADGFPAFYALVGFVSFSFIVLAGQHLRKILMRREDYYHSGPDVAPKEEVRVDDMDVEDN